MVSSALCRRSHSRSAPAHPSSGSTPGTCRSGGTRSTSSSASTIRWRPSKRRLLSPRHNLATTAQRGEPVSDFTMTIDGQAAPTAATFDVLNPATNEVYAQAPECSKEQLDAAMESSAKAYRDWKADEGVRRDALRQVAGILLAASGDLAPVL